MKKLLLFTLVVATLNAATIPVTLIGNNAIPGFVTLDVNGTDYQALDYTGQRYAYQGETWQADIVTQALLPSEGYYGPNDPYIIYSNYLTIYGEEEYLFDQLQSHPSDAAAIQEAAYYLFDPTGPYSINSWVTAAQGAGAPSNAASFEFIDSPLAKGTTLVQGFIIETNPSVAQTPEPATFWLAGLWLAGLGYVAWRRRNHV